MIPLGNAHSAFFDAQIGLDSRGAPSYVTYRVRWQLAPYLLRIATTNGSTEILQFDDGIQ